MRKALVVGINYYEHVDPLRGCVNDAHAVRQVLERHSDGTKNFGVKSLTGTGPADPLSRRDLRAAVEALFADDAEVGLLYFAGHGFVDTTGGFLVTSDSEDGNEGLALSEVMSIANSSRVRNRIIVLDCCHAGAAGQRSTQPTCAEIYEGETILCSSTSEQYSAETEDGGVFTALFVDALNGGASNLVGDVTPGAVYAYIDQSLGEWAQRPMFKTNVKVFMSLRKVQPPISLEDLKMLPKLFPNSGEEFQLDPSYEPESEGPEPDHTSHFAVLQALNRVNLVVPVDAPHMYHAAMESKSCKLTVRGEHYRRLVVEDRL